MNCTVIAFIWLLMRFPDRSNFAAVLMILSIGIWLVAQRLRKRQFGDIRPDSEATGPVSLDTAAFQKAADLLRVAQDYTEICRILESAFAGNEFDAFDLQVNLLPSDYERSPSGLFLKSAQTIDFKWSKPSAKDPRRGLSNWSVTLELLSASNRRRGIIKIYRRYSQTPLCVDMNFLTTVFPTVLADALDRALSISYTRSEGVDEKKSTMGK